MIINIKVKKDLITLDLSTYQLRYLKDYENRGLILFHSLSNSDKEGYEYLFNKDKKLFLETLREDIFSFLDTQHFKIKDMRVLK